MKLNMRNISSSTTYNVSIEDLKTMFANELDCKVEQLQISSRERVISSDPMDRSPTIYGFDGLKITVNK